MKVAYRSVKQSFKGPLVNDFGIILYILTCSFHKENNNSKFEFCDQERCHGVKT